MSLQDPIADMLCRIKNAQAVKAQSVTMPHSTLKEAVANVLKKEGYIVDFEKKEDGKKNNLVLILKYYQGLPVIEMLERVSSPGLRVYKGKDELPKVMDGLGIAIISTSKGVMSNRMASKEGLGGEILCYVS